MDHIHPPNQNLSTEKDISKGGGSKRAATKTETDAIDESSDLSESKRASHAHAHESEEDNGE